MRFDWFDFLAGFSLAFILRTASRFSDGIGYGEIGLGLCIGYQLLRIIAFGPKFHLTEYQKMIAILPMYVIFLLLPITIIYYLSGVTVSFRDIPAYLLSFLFVFTIALRNKDLKYLILVFISVLLFIILENILFGTSQFVPSDRFNGGAKNPNQLALYIICAIVLSWISISNTYTRYVVIILLLTAGYLSGSDAFSVYLFSVISFIVLFRMVSKRYFWIGGIFFLLMLVATGILFGDSIEAVLRGKWDMADEGGSRLTLYANGLKSWLNTPFSFLIGNGAGAFSGLTGTFQGNEAHNTPIDVLALGGIFGCYVFFMYPVRVIRALYLRNMMTVEALFLSIFVFSLFHYVGRTPIFWFTIVAVGTHVNSNRRGDNY